MSRYETRTEQEAVAVLRRFYRVACDPRALDQVQDSERVWRPAPDIAILGTIDPAVSPLGSPAPLWVEVKRLSRDFGSRLSTLARGWRQIRKIPGCVVLARIEGCSGGWYLFDPDEVCEQAIERERGGVRILQFDERLGKPVVFWSTFETVAQPRDVSVFPND